MNLIWLLAHCDYGVVWGKLDAGTEEYFKRINRTSIRFERILGNLTETARVRPIIIQSLFLRIGGEPMPCEEVNAYCERLNTIVRGGGHIQEVHAYTVARPTPESFATRLEADELNAIADHIRRRTNLQVRAFD